MRFRISYSQTRDSHCFPPHANAPPEAPCQPSASFPTSLPLTLGSQAHSWCDPATDAASEPCPDSGVAGKTEWRPDGNLVPAGPELDVWTTAWKWGLGWGDQKSHLFSSLSWSVCENVFAGPWQLWQYVPVLASTVSHLCRGVTCIYWKSLALSVILTDMTMCHSMWLCDRACQYFRGRAVCWSICTPTL